MVEKETKKRPTGVTVLAVLNFIGAFLIILVSIFMLFMSSFIKDVDMSELELPEEEMDPYYGFSPSTFMLGMGVIYLALGVLIIFIGIGYLKGQGWSRIGTLVLIGITFAFTLYGFVVNPQTIFSYISLVFNIAINGLIAWYLGFNERVIQYFSN